MVMVATRYSPVGESQPHVLRPTSESKLMASSRCCTGATSNGTEFTPAISGRILTTSKILRTWKTSRLVTRALGVVTAGILLASGLVAQASEDVSWIQQQFNPQNHQDWPNEVESISTEAGHEGEGKNVRLHLRAKEGMDAPFLSSSRGIIRGVEGFEGGKRLSEITGKASTSSSPGSFLELAQQRFIERQGRAATPEEEKWTFKHLQLVRVPKAASSEASVVARRLAGCQPRGPCCRYPGDPPGSCPSRDLLCSEVVGCTAHSMNFHTRRELQNPRVFSMANVRDVTDRIVSGFFYSPPHSPLCARKEDVDYESCFQEMIDSPRFQNVASKMLCGHHAYNGKTKVCSRRTGPPAPVGDDGSEVCQRDTADVIRGACLLNFITICEAWGSSILLLFETLPWLGPTHEFFPVPESPPDASKNKQHLQEKEHSRQNPKKTEGMKYITPHMIELARLTNGADLELYDFITAKFCARLREAGLLEEVVVQEELSRREQLEERCNNASWVEATATSFKPLTPTDCRLFEPFDRPPSVEL